MSTEPKSINQNDADTFIPEELAEKIREGWSRYGENKAMQLLTVLKI